MMADDLNAPLGQQQETPRRSFQIPASQILAGVLALFLGIFVLWAVIGDNPFGGEPVVLVQTTQNQAPPAKPANQPSPHEIIAGAPAPDHSKGPLTVQVQPGLSAAANTKTVTIIDGKTGARQEVTIPAPNSEAAPAHAAAAAGTVDQKFVEMTPHGPLPKIAEDGVRPADAFAQPVAPIPGKPNAPRVALIVGGLGVSAAATSDAIGKLPSPVTLAFTPYGTDVGTAVSRARAQGHEILLQVPMEPFEYPDNDPGPQTLLTSLTPPQNIERLYWLMSRFQGYVGIINTMGARFTASEPSFAPILHETAKRGLIFVDDGSSPRSVADRIAGANNLPFAKANVVLDSVPTPSEIDRALDRLEMTARERGVAVGISSALPVSIEHIAKWAKAAQSRGLQLVPITAVVAKDKQT